MQGRLEFDRSQVVHAFKRAQFILYDVKYILGSVPTAYDDDLRKGFLHGLSLMLNLLVMMQGMDSVTRQVCSFRMQVHSRCTRNNNLVFQVCPCKLVANSGDGVVRPPEGFRRGYCNPRTVSISKIPNLGRNIDLGGVVGKRTLDVRVR